MPPSSPGSLDQQAVALSKAIRQQESGGDPTRKGASGEYGAYQFLPGTWQKYSQEAGVNKPLEQASLEEQNQVAYHKIKQWKDQGYNPGQIASMWNAGEGEPDAYTGTFKDGRPSKGTNNMGVAYDVPDYAKNVATYYQQFKDQAPQPQQVQSPQTEQKNFTPSDLIPNVGQIGTELTGNIASRFQQGATSASQGIEALSQGNLHKAASGALQTIGAGAGGIGDVVNAGLELVPGIQAAEKGVGGLVQKATNTAPGQAIIKSIQDFSQAHPEISGDIGATVNIASVIPMFKGLSLIKGGITDAATQAIKGSIESSAQEELRNAVGTKVGNSIAAAERRGLNPLKRITSLPQNIPAIEEDAGGIYRYNSEKAIGNMQSSLSQDEESLQNMLNQGVKKNVMVNLEQARQQMLKDVIKDFPVSAKGGQAIRAVNEFFDNVAPTTGGRNWITLNELNALKRDVGGGVNWLNLGSKNGEIKSSMYRSLMTQVEKGAAKAGVKGVGDLNKIMGEKIEALKVLGQLSGKAVKQSKLGKFLREATADVAGGIGEVAGTGTGVPFASTLAGRGLARFLPGRTPLSAVGALGRNGRGSVGTSLRQGLLKSAQGQALRGIGAPQQQ